MLEELGQRHWVWMRSWMWRMLKSFWGTRLPWVRSSRLLWCQQRLYRSKISIMCELGSRTVNLQPTLSQTLPGMQQPPPKLSGHAVSPAGQPDTVLPQTCPLSQQPTSPNPASVVIWQTRPVAQQLFGRLIEVQADVPPGHAKSRVSRAKIASGDRSRRLKRDRVSNCPLVCRE